MMSLRIFCPQCFPHRKFSLLQKMAKRGARRCGSSVFFPAGQDLTRTNVTLVAQVEEVDRKNMWIEYAVEMS